MAIEAINVVAEESEEAFCLMCDIFDVCNPCDANDWSCTVFDGID